MKIKTIDVNAKEWFDKVNGNSYFSARVTINYGLEDQENIYIPYQYGYGDFYTQKAHEILKTKGYIPNTATYPLSIYCREHGIIYRYSKSENCKKRDVIAWGEDD